MWLVERLQDRGISERTILQTWSEIVKDVCENEDARGIKYRDGMVYVGSVNKITHTPAKPRDIQGYMNRLLQYVNIGSKYPLIDAIIIHFYIVYVHPFCDGNGRLARILMSEYMSMRGYPKFAGLVVSKSIHGNLHGYYRTLSESEKEVTISGKKVLDITPFIVYMLNMVEWSFSGCVSFSKSELSELELKLVNKMRKVGNGAEISINKCIKALGVSYDKARVLLNGLCDKGVLCKYKDGRKNIYKLKV